MVVSIVRDNLIELRLDRDNVRLLNGIIELQVLDDAILGSIGSLIGGNVRSGLADRSWRELKRCIEDKFAVVSILALKHHIQLWLLRDVA